MKRIAILGNGGAGKSTLALALGKALSLPVHHLDRIFWTAGWQRLTQEEFAGEQRRILAEPSWIVDGNYGSTMELRIQAAEAIVFLDPPPALCLWRLGRRYLRFRSRSRPDMADGCPERLTLEFVIYVARYRRTRRPGILRRLKALSSDQQAFILRSPAQVRSFLDQARSTNTPRARSSSPPRGSSSRRS